MVVEDEVVAEGVEGGDGSDASLWKVEAGAEGVLKGAVGSVEEEYAFTARNKTIWADGGYTGKLVGEIAALVRHLKVRLEIVKRSDDVKGFKILPKRWIVERTFGWLIQSGRLVRDYEVLPLHSESMIYLSTSKRMLRRITA